MTASSDSDNQKQEEAKSIKPEDVRVGDRIRVEWMKGDVFKTWTGTIALIDGDGDPWTQEDWLIGPTFIQERINKGERITITLLDRPKPKLPTEVGSVIHVSECRGEVCDTLAIFDSGGWWNTAESVDGRSFHSPSNITEWEPRNVVEVQE